MAAAALELASLQRFGGPGGRTHALLHEAYLAAADSPAARARLAAALARSWVYGNDAARGAPFALEAVELAEETHDSTVLADALDAQLATSWGPDDLPERLQITARLQDVAAHVDDVRTRMDAHLWRLTTALETLDVSSIGTRRALDLARANDARFFLASTSEVYGDPLVHPQTEEYWGNVNPVGPRAVYDEANDEWVLNGTKAWITNGGIADVHVVVAAVDPELKGRGQASFIVPSGTKGLSQGQKYKKHGIRASHTAEVVLEDVRVPGRCLLGGKEKLDGRIARAGRAGLRGAWRCGTGRVRTDPPPTTGG